MTTLIDVLGQWVIDHYTWRYLIIATGAFIQGEITIFIAVTLILNNYLDWGGYVLAVLSGLAFYEIFLFWLGKSLKNAPLGKKWEMKIMKSEKMQRYLRHHMDHFLIISKFLIYINVGAIVLSGLMNMKFRKFLTNRLIANVLWLSAITVGSYLILSGLTLLKLKQIEIGMVVFLILVFIANALLRKQLTKETAEEYKHRHPGQKS